MTVSDRCPKFELAFPVHRLDGVPDQVLEDPFQSVSVSEDDWHRLDAAHEGHLRSDDREGARWKAGSRVYYQGQLDRLAWMSHHRASSIDRTRAFHGTQRRVVRCSGVPGQRREAGDGILYVVGHERADLVERLERSHCAGRSDLSAGDDSAACSPRGQRL
jgi:hypothetical protein